MALAALLGAGLLPVLVVTLPPEAAARHSDFADLGPMATSSGIPLHLTKSINAPETFREVARARPDIVLVIGWSQVCEERFRSIATLGAIGFHPTALPRMRGRGVIPWTILNKETTTGSTLFWLGDGIDSGPILLQRLFDVTETETARSLYSKHMLNLREMVPLAIRELQSGKASMTPQDEAQASYCARRRAEDGLIDWHRPSEDIERLIRAVGEPYPGAYTYSGNVQLHIDEATIFYPQSRYIGIAGQVQAITDSTFLVMCGDGGCIEARQWRPSNHMPRLHAHLRTAASPGSAA